MSINFELILQIYSNYVKKGEGETLLKYHET